MRLYILDFKPFCWLIFVLLYEGRQMDGFVNDYRGNVFVKLRMHQKMRNLPIYSIRITIS